MPVGIQHIRYLNKRKQQVDWTSGDPISLFTINQLCNLRETPKEIIIHGNKLARFNQKGEACISLMKETVNGFRKHNFNLHTISLFLFLKI